MNNKIPKIHKKVIRETIKTITSSVPVNIDKLAFYFLESILEDLRQAKRYDYIVDGKIYIVYDGKENKIAIGPDYNFYFSKINGEFRRWGKNIDDDPEYSPIGPEILDCEISINGCPNAQKCKFCYKNNTNEPATNMTLEQFKVLIDKFTKALGQVAFGITGIQTNPDFIPMMKYCREIGIVPNFTLSGIDLTDEIAKQCSELIGAVAVSAYSSDKNICYNTVKKFTDLGVRQTNIHLLASIETLDFVYEVLKDRMTDSRLSNMNSIVFLGVKPKGRAKDNYHPLTSAQYKELIEFCFANNLSIGFDSCSAPKFESAVNKMSLSDIEKKRLISCSESCESGIFSFYSNVKGEYFPCSFTEKERNWQTGPSVLEAKDFLKDIWYHPRNTEWRNSLLKTCKSGCRQCLSFPEINPKECLENNE